MSTKSPATVPFYASPLGVWGIVALWGMGHLLLRSLLSPVLGTDDMYENILVQTLQPGYILRQPPLYEWLLWSVQQVFGPTIWSFLILKYGLISLASLFLFLLARRAITDVLLAALCVFSYSLYYQYGWNLHEGVTHTVVLTATCAATAWAFVRALERGRWSDYLVLGLCFGLGLLSKHSYPLFPLALLGSALSLGALRNRLRVSGLALSLVAAVLVYSPYLTWILSEGLSLLRNTAETMGVVDQKDGHLVRVVTGLGRLAFSLVGFSVPLVPILVLIFWQRYRLFVRGGQAGESGQMDKRAMSLHGRFFGRTVLIMITVTAVLILVTGATYVKERHMHPLLLLLPLFLFADLDRFAWLEGISKACKRLVLAICAVALVAFVARVPGLLAPDRIGCGGKCRHMKPYAALQEPLEAMGADKAILIAEEDYLAGNLRVLFPAALVRNMSWASSLAARRSNFQPEACLFLWEEGEAPPAKDAETRLTERFSDRGLKGREVPATYLSGEWPHLFKPAGWRTTWWGVKVLDPASARCQSGTANW